MKKWEYFVAYGTEELSFESFLNKMGKEGWELIIANYPLNSLSGIATFKREVNEEK